MIHQYGIANEKALRWGVTTWFNLPPGKQAVDIQDFAGKIIYLYCFQAWCPGCHSHGFPTLLNVRQQFSTDSEVAFVAIQTVFEGFQTNTLERAKEVARQYNLTIPFGHDPGPDGKRSLVMQRYRTAGTPWTTVIDGAGIVRYNAFRADAYQMTDLINQLRRTAKK